MALDADSLMTGELGMLTRDRETLRWLHQAVWQADRDSYWAAFHRAARK